MKELYVKKPNGRYAVADSETVLQLAAKYRSQLFDLEGTVIRSPGDTETFLQERLRDELSERFCIVYLDNRHRVITFRVEFNGTIDGTSVYPREVVKNALRFNAAAVILCHNHPSGVAEPSQADERITRRIKAALEMVDIRTLDHLSVTREKCTSLASRGML